MTIIEEASVDIISFTETVEICGFGNIKNEDLLRQAQANISWENEEMALAIIEEMLITEPQNKNLLAYKAFCLYMLDRNGVAMQLCDRLLHETNGKGIASAEYDIPKGFIHQIKAMILLEDEKFTQALNTINEAMIQDNHPVYYGFRAVIYLVEEKFDAAFDDANFTINNYRSYSSVFGPDENEILAEMYAIRAITNIVNGRSYEQDLVEAINRGSEIISECF